MKLTLQYPVKPVQINQPFGNPDPKYSALGLNAHNGIDFGVHHGDPVYATHDGIALHEIDGKGGWGVVLRTSEKFDYDGGLAFFKTIYWHLCDSTKEPQFESPIFSNPNKLVKTGDIIGYADNTGMSTGDHLHFGLKPMLQDEDNGVWYNVKQANGYLGAIDPKPYFFDHIQQPFPDGSIKGVIKKLISTLKFGDTGQEVRRLQQMLIDTGYSIPAGSTGNYGIQTQTAVQQWLQKNG